MSESSPFPANIRRIGIAVPSYNVSAEEMAKV